MNDVYLISDKLTLATNAQIAVAEASLATRFPAGYREYVTTLGAGYLNGRMRVIPPSEIVEQTAEFRERLDFLYGDAATVRVRELLGFLYRDATADYDPFQLFETGLDLLPPDRLFNCILVIDAGDGHEIIYHPDTPDDIFLLPHDQEGIYKIGRTIEEALAAFLSNELYVHETQVLTAEGQFEDRPVYYFEPDRSAERVSFRLDPAVSYGEVRAHLIEAALEQPTGSLMVRETYLTDDGTERENLHLFVREYGGAVGTREESAHRGGISVQLAFDSEHRTESLVRVLNFFRSRARYVTYNDGIERPV